MRRRVRCVGCSFAFEYVATRDGWGGGHSPFIVFNNAEQLPQPKSVLALASTAHLMKRSKQCLVLLAAYISRTWCAHCANAMERTLSQTGMQQTESPFRSWAAWQTARSINSKESYRKFMETWPVVDDHNRPSEILSLTARALNYYAKEAVAELKYPPLVRKIGAKVWIAWGAALFVVAIAMLTG